MGGCCFSSSGCVNSILFLAAEALAENSQLMPAAQLIQANLGSFSHRTATIVTTRNSLVTPSSDKALCTKIPISNLIIFFTVCEVRHGYKHLFTLAVEAYINLEKHVHRLESRQKKGQVKPPSKQEEWCAWRSWSQMDFKCAKSLLELQPYSCNLTAQKQSWKRISPSGTLDYSLSTKTTWVWDESRLETHVRWRLMLWTLCFCISWNFWFFKKYEH